jgi:hypothetical protein
MTGATEAVYEAPAPQGSAICERAGRVLYIPS